MIPTLRLLCGYLPTLPFFMLNSCSPAPDISPPSPLPLVRVRYPSVPPGLRWLRLKFKLLGVLAPELAFRASWRVFTTPRRLPRRPWEAAALAGARRSEVPVESGRVVAYEWNPTGARTVLLVHGWEHRASFWGALARELVKAGYRVVALDGPAHGDSAGQRATLISFAGAVQAVVDTLGCVHGVVAHSFGAACTAGVPVRFNAAAGGRLPRLVLMSAPSSTRRVAERFASLLQLPDRVVARMGEFIQQQYGRSAESFSLLASGRHLPVDRALLLHDRDDAHVPFTDAEEIAAHWPALILEPTTGLGHNRILRDPAVARRICAFLD